MRVLTALREAAVAAADLGLDREISQTEELISRAEARLGFGGSAYVLALAGGTGVGKSSLLNALAGDAVSTVGVIRPTTARPLAWVAENQRDEVGPLLEWLGVEDVFTHQRAELGGVVILDLPDFDSVETDHRATVDKLLPRIDSMLWVTDPEKYDDELLHSYLRDLTVHADRIGFVINKSDRLEPAEQKLLRDDFVLRLKTDGYRHPRVHMISARTGEGLSSLLEEVKQRSQDKELVTRKLAADMSQRLRGIAVASGVDGSYRPLIEQRDRSDAVAAAVAGALAVVDPDGVAAQVKAAALYRARRQGGSLLARVLALLSNLTGTRKRSADPEGFLISWRQRGSIGHVVNPIRRVIVDAVSRLPANTRPGVMRKVEFDQLEEHLTSAVEQAVRGSRNDLAPARSALWIVIGGLQLILGATFLFAVAWYLTLIFGPQSLPVGSFEVPYLGPVPVPLVLLVGSLVASLVLGLILNLHAGWLGRRRGAKVATRVRHAIENTILIAAFGPVDQIEAARERIAAGYQSLKGSPVGPLRTTAFQTVS